MTSMNEPCIYPLILLTEARCVVMDFDRLAIWHHLPGLITTALGGPLILFKELSGVLCIRKASKSKNLRFFTGYLTFKICFPAWFQVWGLHKMGTTYWWCSYLYIRFENQQRIDAAWKNRGTLLIWVWNCSPPHTYNINRAPWWPQNEY